MSDYLNQIKKRQLLAAVNKERNAAQDEIKQGQELVREGTLLDAVGQCVEDFARSIPDDTYLSDMTWNQATTAFIEQAQMIYNQLPGETNTLHFTAASTFLTTSDFVSPTVFVRPMPTQTEQSLIDVQNRLASIVGSADWDSELEQDFQRLGLEVTRADKRSALQLLAASQDALKRPSGVAVDPVAVLIPLREAINCSLADLLQRRPLQEKTPQIGEKVRSICEQLGRPDFPREQIVRLAEESRKLIDDLSASKQQALDGAEVRELFVKGKAFLKALLCAVDETRLLR